MSSASTAWGLTVQMALTSAPTVFTTLSEVFDVSFPEAVFDDIDVTHYASPGRKREYITGLADSGDFDFTMNYVPGSATDSYLRTALGNQRVVKITFPTGDSVTFTANIKKYNPDAVPVDGKMTAKCGGKVSGDPSYGAAAAPVNALLPSISGVLTSGSTLTANEGTWSGAPTFTYQWRRDGVNIGGATSSTYVLVAGDVTHGIDLVVTATNGAGSTNATSAKTANVA